LGLKLRAHEVLHDVPLYDVSVVDLPGGGAGRSVADIRALDATLPPSRVANALFGVRRFLGRVFSWDRVPIRPEDSLLGRRVSWLTRPYLIAVEPLPLLPPLPRLFALHAGYGSEGGRHRMIVEQPHPFVHFRTESEDPVWLRVAHPPRDSVAAVLAAVAAVSWRDARRITGSRRRGPR